MSTGLRRQFTVIGVVYLLAFVVGMLIGLLTDADVVGIAVLTVVIVTPIGLLITWRTRHWVERGDDVDRARRR